MKQFGLNTCVVVPVIFSAVCCLAGELFLGKYKLNLVIFFACKEGRKVHQGPKNIRIAIIEYSEQSINTFVVVVVTFTSP